MEDRRAHIRIDELEIKLNQHLDDDAEIHKKIMENLAINTELTKRTSEMTVESMAIAKTIADNTTELVAIIKGTKWTAIWLRRLALWALPILTAAGLIIEWVRRH